MITIPAPAPTKGIKTSILIIFGASFIPLIKKKGWTSHKINHSLKL